MNLHVKLMPTEIVCLESIWFNDVSTINTSEQIMLKIMTLFSKLNNRPIK